MSTTEMNITPSAITNMCDEKCLFSYSYPIVNTLNISNNGNNYVITYSSSNPPVTFNNLGYNLQNVSIYFPSLHTFNNTSEVGEIVMNHVCQTTYIHSNFSIKDPEKKKTFLIFLKNQLRT